MWYLFFKRTFDIVFSLISLVMLSPVLAVLAILIKMEDGGPVFYRGERAGVKDKVFRTFKFRTMVIDAEKVGGPSTSDDDPRITRIGSVMRKYKLDEMPQLIDVFRGSMSFVGPRPEVLSEVKDYTDEEKRILTVRPGITDWSSLEFHDEGAILKGSEDPHKAYLEKIRPRKMELALKYVDKRSFGIDMRIIFKTAQALLITRSRKR